MSRLQSASGTKGTTGTTFGVAFTTQNIAAGNRIVVRVTIWNAVATTVTGVADTPGNAYTLDKRVTLSDGTDITVWSAPITVGAGTKPTVTATASASTLEWAVVITEQDAIAGGTTGYTDGTAGTATGAAGSTVSSGATSPVPTASGEQVIGMYGDGGNNTTITVGSGWSGFLFTGASSTVAEVAAEDQSSTSGTGSNAQFGCSPTGSPAGAIAVVYKSAPAGTVPTAAPSRMVRAPLHLLRAQFAFLSAQRYQAYAPSGTSIALASDPASSAAFGGAAASAVLSVALAATSPAFSTASGSASLAKALASAAQAVSAGPGLLTLAEALQSVAPGTTGAQATIAKAIALAATSPAVSREAAALAEALALGGTAAAVSRASAALAEAIALAALAPAYSGAAANLQVLTGTQIAGLAAAVSGGTGTLSLAEALAARSPGTSGALGALRLAIALAGSAPAVSREAAQLGLGIPLAGRGAAVTGATGALAPVQPGTTLREYVSGRRPDATVESVRPAATASGRRPGTATQGERPPQTTTGRRPDPTGESTRRAR